MLLIEIAFWIAGGCSLTLIVVPAINEYISLSLLCWIGGLPIIALFVREFFMVQISLVNKGMPIALLIPLGIISFFVSSYIFWHLIKKIIPPKVLQLTGKLTILALTLYLYFKVLQIRYPAFQLSDTFSSLAIALSLQSTFGRWLTQAIIPISIPVAITFWGWLNQRRQFKVSQTSESEKLIRSYANDIFDFLNEIHGIYKEMPPDDLEWKIEIARMKTQSVLISLNNLDSQDRYKPGNRRIIQFLIGTEILSKYRFNILKYADMSFSDLSEIDLKGAKLRKINFNMSSFENSNLSGSDLSSSTFRDCNFAKANLSALNCEKAIFDGSIFIDRSSFSYVFSRSINREREASANFSGSNLKKASFRQSDLGASDFSGADFSGADFSDSKQDDVFWGRPESGNDSSGGL